MDLTTSLRASLLGAWRTTNRANTFLIEQLPAELWVAKVPGYPRRTIRTIAAHLNNSRCSWIKTLGREHGIAAPPLVNLNQATPRQVVAALRRSSGGMEELLTLGLDNGGELPPSKGYVWRNLPLDVGHVLAYFVAHEGHHRGQIIMLARQLGHRLPAETVNGIWMWTKRAKEA